MTTAADIDRYASRGHRLDTIGYACACGNPAQLAPTGFIWCASRTIGHAALTNYADIDLPQAALTEAADRILAADHTADRVCASERRLRQAQTAGTIDHRTARFSALVEAARQLPTPPPVDHPGLRRLALDYADRTDPPPTPTGA